ncbi:hypothetical protein [Leptospira levettii]|uniref:hypothetical protein n=1 Tax=Leptospira levettii TaxID=2023178 RepID=UPI00108398C7|nr:hypothetical protein [Leptospira levettii]TGL10242.1 hypothetical protein EHQ39_08810 [Leptospira levettii]
MKFKTLLIMNLIILNFCGQSKIEKEEDEVDPFYIKSDNECYLNKGDNLDCKKKKNEVACFETLSDLKNSRLDNIFFGKVWMSSDQQTHFYHVDSKGKVKIFEGGPDKLPQQRLLVGRGKFYVVNKKWYYEQVCQSNGCESFNIQITYLGCELTTDLTESNVLRFIEFGNRKLITIEENQKDNKYKLISFTQEQPIKNQIFNGFISTKVPPILEKR